LQGLNIPLSQKKKKEVCSRKLNPKEILTKLKVGKFKSISKKKSLQKIWTGIWFHQTEEFKDKPEFACL